MKVISLTLDVISLGLDVISLTLKSIRLTLDGKWYIPFPVQNETNHIQSETNHFHVRLITF